MREILFRGKRIGNGEWVEGSLLVWPDGDAEICHTKPDIVHEMLKAVVYPETVGQFTGLTDKNGKKIFEGDIIKAISSIPLDERTEKPIVVRLDDYELMWDITHSFEYEVIGNIHDNPELLGGGEGD